MPDYDPKSIPILDDIIEDDKTEAELTGSDAAGFDDKQDSELADDNLDLFDSAETAEPEIGSIDQFINPANNGFEEDEAEKADSALIGYHSEEVDDPAAYLPYEAAQPEEVQQDIVPPTADFSHDDMSIDDTSPASVQPVALDSIVDEIVKQLMPDLEQQLRFLVQQALEDRLPAELIEQMPADKSADTDL